MNPIYDTVKAAADDLGTALLQADEASTSSDAYEILGDCADDALDVLNKVLEHIEERATGMCPEINIEEVEHKMLALYNRDEEGNAAECYVALYPDGTLTVINSTDDPDDAWLFPLAYLVTGDVANLILEEVQEYAAEYLHVYWSGEPHRMAAADLARLTISLTRRFYSLEVCSAASMTGRAADLITAKSTDEELQELAREIVTNFNALHDRNRTFYYPHDMAEYLRAVREDRN